VSPGQGEGTQMMKPAHLALNKVMMGCEGDGN
jgi:hypothetical protein